MYNKLKEEERAKVAYQNDEVDLWQFFRRVGASGQSLNKKFSGVLRLLRQQTLLILLFVCTGLALSYWYYTTRRPYYTSSMTFVLAKIRNDFVEEQLNGLAEMVREKNFEAIAENLDITPESAQQIKDLDFKSLDKDIIEEDSVLTGSPFRIQLQSYDNNLFNSLEPAITNFLESNRYFSRQKQIKEIQYRKMITKYKSDIISIDSIKETVVSPRGPVNGFVYGEPLDPTELYRQGIDMYRRQVELEAELDQIDNIQVVNGFVPRATPSGPDKIMYLLAGGVLFFFIGLFVANLVENRKRKNVIL